MNKYLFCFVKPDVLLLALPTTFWFFNSIKIIIQSLNSDCPPPLPPSPATCIAGKKTSSSSSSMDISSTFPSLDCVVYGRKEGSALLMILNQSINQSFNIFN